LSIKPPPKKGNQYCKKASKRASKQAGRQASKQASEQTSMQASKRKVLTPIHFSLQPRFLREHRNYRLVAKPKKLYKAFIFHFSDGFSFKRQRVRYLKSDCAQSKGFAVAVRRIRFLRVVFLSRPDTAPRKLAGEEDGPVLF